MQYTLLNNFCFKFELLFFFLRLILNIWSGFSIFLHQERMTSRSLNFSLRYQFDYSRFSIILIRSFQYHLLLDIYSDVKEYCVKWSLLSEHDVCCLRREKKTENVK